MMIEGRGQRTSSTCGAEPLEHRADAGRLDVAVRPRTARSRSAARARPSAREMPTSRAMASSGSAVRWVSSSTRRWVTGSLASASRVAATSGSRPFIRLHQPGLAPAQRARPGERADVLLAVLEPRDLPPVVPGDDHRVAHRLLRGLEVAGEGVGLHEEAGADVLVERLEAVLVRPAHGLRPRYGTSRNRPKVAWVRRGTRDRTVTADARRRMGPGAMTALLPDRETRPRDQALRRRGQPRPAAPPAAGAARRPRPASWPRRGTLTVCLAVGVAGWFLTDAGAHGAPRDGLRTGALAWLMAHGSGRPRRRGRWSPSCRSASRSSAPGRSGGRRTGSATRSPGHGPDADRIADGERDWTVPVAALVFTSGVRRDGGRSPARWRRPRRPHPTWPGSCCGRSCSAGCSAPPAIAAGSGRAAVWGDLAPRVAWWPPRPRAAPC